MNITAKTIIAGLFSALATGAAADEQLVMNTYFGTTYFLYQPIVEWTEDVAKATNGRVTISIPAGALTPPPKMVSSVRTGIADIGITANIFFQQQVPELSFPSLPFQISDAEAASVAVRETYDEFLADKKPMNRLGVELLSIVAFNAAHLYSVNGGAIDSIEELKSRRMWSLPGYTTDLIVNLGITPVTGPAVMLNEHVSKGVLDAYFGVGPDAVTDFNVLSYTDGVTVFPTGVSTATFSIFINERVWKRLSDEDRAAIASVSGVEFSRKIGAAAQAYADDAMSRIADAGAEVIDASPAFYAAMQEAAVPIYNSFYEATAAQGVDGKALVKSFRDNYAKAAQ